MNKILKYGAIALAGLIVLVLVVVGIVAATFNPNDYKPMVVKMVQEKKQRTLNIEGDIKLSFWPKIGANLGRISISEHKSDKEFAAVESLKVSLALLPLLKKELIVDTIYVDGARANIVRYEDGTTNYDDLLSEDESESEQIKFDVDGVIVTNSAITYTDLQAGNEIKLSKFNLETGHVALASPFDVATDFELSAKQPELNIAAKIKGNFMADPEQKHFVAKGLDANVQGDFAGGKEVVVKLTGDVDARPENMEFLVDGLKLAMTGNFDGAKVAVDLVAPKLVVQEDEVSGKEASLSLTREKGSDSVKANLVLADIKGSPKAVQSSGISGDIAAKQGARTVQGKFSSPFSGNLEQLIFDLPKLAGNLDVKDPALPGGAMKGDFALKLHADVKQEQVKSDFNLAIDTTKLNGDVAVAGFKKPNIKFNLNADTLDLNKLLGQPSAKAEKAADSGPAKPTDLSALKDLLLEGKVSIGSILYDKYRLTGLNMGIKADGERLNVSPFAVKLDESQIKGSFGISRFAKPIYHFDVDIDKLDADRYIAKSDDKPAAADNKPATDTPIDLSALKAINADGELRIGWLNLANVKSTNVRIKLKADDGVAQLAPFSANLYEGAMNGSLQVDARAIPQIAFKQNMTGIAIGPLLVDAINNDMLSGKGNLNLDVKTSGATVNTLKKSLNGTAGLNLADGAVKGIDIAGTIRGYKDKLSSLKGQASVEGDKTQKTDFSEMSATFNIKNGVAHNDDLNMKAPLFRITGSGDIDIGNETIDYLAKPTVVKTLAGQGGAGLDELSGVTIPVKLTGTFAKPKYALDFAGVATAMAKKKVIDKVGGEKGEAVQKLLDGDAAGGLEGLLKKKAEPAPTEKTADPATTPPAEEQPASKEDKVKQKLDKLLGF
ncbi:MAG: AsmA family protein [Betaproteobacteria bacterium HGW-Betaproteobacteria-1]|jgi:AsmA protein|nr:MAG: AsmA family protein [Betaproteobacteria bacterium HGW-Betaproteobacteria-1]